MAPPPDKRQSHYRTYSQKCPVGATFWRVIKKWSMYAAPPRNCSRRKNALYCSSTKRVAYHSFFWSSLCQFSTDSDKLYIIRMGKICALHCTHARTRAHTYGRTHKFLWSVLCCLLFLTWDRIMCSGRYHIPALLPSGGSRGGGGGCREGSPLFKFQTILVLWDHSPPFWCLNLPQIVYARHEEKFRSDCMASLLTVI